MFFDFDAALEDQLAEATTMAEVHEGLITLLSRIRAEHPEKGVFYVIGIITSDGEEHVQRNLELLASNTQLLRQHYGPLIFSARSVWSDGLFARVGSSHLREEDFITLWRLMLRSGLVTGILMTPRWECSRGARDEYETARSLNLEIHFPEVLFGQQAI